ncbi:MAG: hypothetical protein JNL38_18830 [Myxococcales bacterium]|nr:hypothetical protein [Myxococcales bacterium]
MTRPPLQVRARTELTFSAGADPSVDRPGHVRSGSALVWRGRDLVVVSDDASFFAIVSLGEHLRVDAVSPVLVPHAPGGARQFDDRRGNKADKLDLEAAALHGGSLLAFGSGSTPARRSVVAWDGAAAPRVVELSAFYDELTRALAAGGTLNVEGAVVVGDRLFFAHRGNGDASGTSRVGSTSADELFRHADGRGPCPRVGDVIEIGLGRVGGTPLTVTDLFDDDGVLSFVASAEASPDAVRDGPVAGSVVGTLGSPAGARLVVDADGRPFTGKIEGAARARGALFAITDRDDPDAPAELLLLEAP